MSCCRGCRFRVTCAAKECRMPAIVILGAQWGDEGKGKATDLLATTDGPSTSWSAPAAATTPATPSSSTARSSRPTCCPAASSPRVRPSVIANGVVVSPEALFRELDALIGAGGRAGRPGGQRQRARDRVVPLDGRQGHRALPRQEPDRHHRPRHRAGVLRQGQPTRHPGRRPVRRGHPAAEGRGVARPEEPACWPRSTTGARSRWTRSSRSCCRTPTGCGRWSPTRRCC